eukprot:comp24263_c11_seq1/m.45117 comp24263_c11_seq1/g.45117  ORF comp24263_c11_seq1/g.45117 comp24263_c11_seq1/m.45117 type:complete len:405 (-) comp24263_c11_seq1:208-1422(-)
MEALSFELDDENGLAIIDSDFQGKDPDGKGHHSIFSSVSYGAYGEQLRKNSHSDSALPLHVLVRLSGAKEGFGARLKRKWRCIKKATHLSSRTCRLVLVLVAVWLLVCYMACATDVLLEALADNTPMQVPPSALGRPDHIPPCQGWPEPAPIPPVPMRAWNVANLSVEIIAALNDMGLIYTFEAGSLLGSYRHGGLIPGDKDLDVFVPVWRNLHLLDAVTRRGVACKEAEMGVVPRDHGNMYTRLCGRTPAQWSQVFLPVFVQAMARYNYTVYVKNLREYDAHFFVAKPCRSEFNPNNLERRNCFSADITFFNNLPWAYNLCRCRWYGAQAMCSQQAAEWMAEYFGPNYMVPDRNLNDTSKWQRLESGLRLEWLRMRNMTDQEIAHKALYQQMLMDKQAKRARS